MKDKILKCLLPVEATYVRGGKYSEMTAKEINEKMRLAPDILVVKHSPDGEFDRRLAVKFDLSEIDGGFVRLCIQTSMNISEKDIFFNVYPIDIDRDYESLTAATLPEYCGEPLGQMLVSGFEGLDLTEFVRAAKAEGKREVAFVVSATKTTDCEIRMKNPKITGSDIRIEVLEKAPTETYVKALTGDPERDADIWAWAQKLFDEWYERYQAILSEPEREVEMIESPAEQYTESVLWSSSSKTYDTAKHAAPTRTYKALTDIDEYAPQKEYKTDKFGGLMDESMKQEATGFFYVKKIGKRFWVIDPLGYPFVVRALSGITPHYQGSEYQKENAIKKYGSLEKWGEETNRHLKEDLYFFAGASPNEMITRLEEPVAIQKAIGFVYAYGCTIGTGNSKGGSSTFSENNTMNVFDPGFVEYAAVKAKDAEKYRDDPYILGYTTDNELPMQERMILSYLTVDPAKEVNYYSYAAAWTWLKNMSGKEMPHEHDVKPEYYELFRGFVWDRYYNVVCSALRRVDPNHMILGTRFLTAVRKADWVLKFAGKYLDCITINWYFTWQPQAESVYNFAKNADCPFMVTEFYTKAGDSGLGNTSGAGQYVATQKDRGMFYQNYTLRLLEATNCVGWHWFQYIDNDPRNAIRPDGTVRDISSTNSNKGIISNEHEEYTECTEYMKEINKNVYRIIEYFDKKYGR